MKDQLGLAGVAAVVVGICLMSASVFYRLGGHRDLANGVLGAGCFLFVGGMILWTGAMA